MECLKKDCNGSLYICRDTFICTKEREHVFTLKEVEDFYDK